MTSEETNFLAWFTNSGGSYDATSVGLQHFPDAGRGAVALRNIQKGEVLFSIPRHLLLSTRTSPLRTQLSAEERRSLGKGWAALILCMMHEDAKGDRSKWAGYLGLLPTQFDSPMFWTAEELEELKATSIADKIGKDGAESDYREKVLPLLQARPDLFPSTEIDTIYSLDRYHLMGSRILSRSFHVEEWEQPEQDDDVESDADEGMDVDGPVSHGEAGTNEGDIDEVEAAEGEDEDRSEDEDDDEDTDDISMVPFADLLNARHSCDNARLFYEENELKMTATRDIPAGEQIWNTYGDPPNSDLLRRYGHVDLIPLKDSNELGNPSDEVEIRADLIVPTMPESTNSKERIDWWLEEGGDDTFSIGMDYELPPGLVSLIRLLLLDDKEWEVVKEKGKLPKPKPDVPTLEVVAQVLKARSSEYPTSIEEDEALVSGSNISRNRLNAIIVRLGEKRILANTLREVELSLEKLRAESSKPAPTSKKRKAESSSHGGSRKKKVK